MSTGMKKLQAIASRFANDESGATAIEYAMIASGIAMAIIAVVIQLGGTVSGLFQAVVAYFQANT